MWFLVRLVILWAATEWLVSLAIALIWLGKDGSIDTVLPFGSLTPLIAYTPLRLITRLVGFYGSSALAVLLISVLALPKLRQYAPATILTVITVTVVAWLPYRSANGPEVSATIMAGRLDRRLPPSGTDTQLVVYPEYGLDSFSGEDMQKMLGQQYERYFVGSKRQPGDSGATQNVLIFGSNQQGILAERPKSRLIPGGEYLPYAVSTILDLANRQDTLDQFKYTQAIERGPHDGTPLAMDENIKLGSAVCASIISPQDYREFTQNGATILTNSASLGLFNSPIFTAQHQGLARFMATANARPFLQATFGNKAFAIDHNGKLVAETHPVSSTDVRVQANTKTTPYTMLGEWVVYAGIAFGFWKCIGLLRGRLNLRNKK